MSLRFLFILWLSAALAGRAGAASPLPIAATAAYEAFPLRGSAAAPLAGGGFAVLWSTGDTPFHTDVRLQYLGADGSPRLGAEGVPVADTIDWETAGAVAAAPAGGAYAAYLRSLPHTAEIRLFVQAFDGEGRPLWPGDGVTPVERADRDVHAEPRLLADAAGGVFVCLTRDDGASGVSREIVCQHLGRDGGRLWGDDGRKAGGRDGTRELPGVVSDGKGGILVFWLNRRDLFAPGAGDPELVEGQRFSPDGRALWGEGGRTIHDTARPSSGVSDPLALLAVPNGAGGAVLAFRAWSRTGSGPSRTDDVVAQRVDPAGRLRWAGGTVVSDLPEEQRLKALVPTLDGGAAVVAASLTGGEATLRLYRLANGGRQLWTREGIAFEPHAGSPLDDTVRGAFDGRRLQLAWVARPAGTAEGRTEVRLAAFDSRGRRLGGGARALEGLEDGFQEMADLRLDAARKVCLALWNRAAPSASGGEDAVGALTSVR